MSNIIILNTHPKKKSIKPYILNNLYDTCEEIFISQLDYLQYIQENSAFTVPKGCSKVVTYNPYTNKPILIKKGGSDVDLFYIDQAFSFSPSSDTYNMIYLESLFSTEPKKIDNQSAYQVSKTAFQDAEKNGVMAYTLNDDKLTGVLINIDQQNIRLQASNSLWNVTGKSSRNTIHTEGGNSEIYFRENAKGNTANGHNGSDIMAIYQNASNNILNGGDATDILVVNGEHSKFNVLNGDDGHDSLFAYDATHYNALNGGKGNDTIDAFNFVMFNTLNGDEGNDTINIMDNASSNEGNGGNDDDTLTISGIATKNIINGNKGNDLLLAYELSKSNILNGDENNDTLMATADCSLKGGLHDDFLFGYIVSPDYRDNVTLNMNGNDDNDTLIGSSLSWFLTNKNENNPQTLWTFKGESGHDWIMPHISSEYIDTASLHQDIQNDIEKKLKVTKETMQRTSAILNSQYDISLGEGKDTLLLSAQDAEQTQTHISELNLHEDLIAFDNKDMAQAFLSQIQYAQALHFKQARFSYNGHQYIIDMPSTAITLQKDSDMSGFDIFCPVLPSSTLSYDYGLYHINSKVNVSTLREDLNISKNTFTNILNFTCDKNIFVSTKPTIELISDKENNMKIYWEAHNIHVPFAPRFLFEDKGVKAVLYEHISSDKPQYFESDENSRAPKNIMAVIVQQDITNGLIFTTENNHSLLPKDMADNQLKTYSASDFFEKGHFVKTNNNRPNHSATLRLGFVIKGNDNNLITTPMSDTMSVSLISK